MISARVFIGLCTLTLAVSPLTAQEIRGRVVAADGGEPLPGAYVVLVDGDDVVDRTVTSVDGTFSLAGSRPGAHTIRAEHIGYAGVDTLVDAGSIPFVELRAPLEAIELDGLLAQVERECRIPEDVALRLHDLWSRVSTAFRVAEVIEDRGLHRFEVARWQRRLEPGSLRIEEEERRTRIGFHAGSPFQSLEPRRLSSDGYIQERADRSHQYYAPDVRVLMSPSFMDDHCFGLTQDRPSDGSSDWVGITFRPAETAPRDIQGTLWVDAGTLRPRRLDFLYSDLPRELPTGEVGGRVEFFQLPDGGWIVSRWWIRMPAPELTRRSSLAGFGRGGTRYRIAALVEEGGEVVRVRAPGGRVLSVREPGTIRGVVYGGSGDPLPGAHVALPGTTYGAETDHRGRFSLEGVAEGRYRATWTSDAFESLGLEGESARVDVISGESTRVRWTLPPVGAAAAEQCARPVDAEGDGVLYGKVLSAGGPANGDEAVVRISWREVASVPAGEGVPSARPAEVTALIPVAAGGLWMACGVPNLRPLEIAAAAVPLPRSGAPAGSSTRLTLERGEASEVTLRLPSRDELPPVIALDPLTVTVEGARRMLAEVGMREDELGRRFMDRASIEEALEEGAVGVEGVIRRLRLPGLVLDRLSGPTGGLCLHSYRYRTYSRYQPRQLCARIYIDGMPAEADRLDGLSPSDIESLAFLREAEAGAVFGTGTGGGVLVIWLR